jgi:outer membrane receptor protein involved in Fe transport
LLAASLSFPSLPCHAQDPTELDAVIVLGRYEDVGVSDSASQGGVTRQGIEKRPLMRPGEIAEAVPGMIVTQHSGDGKANQFFLRGYNLDHGTDFATWVAGMPVNMPTHAHGHGYTDLNFVIPELISRIAYNKGPYFAEDGDFGSAGSARIGYADKLPFNIASLTAGSFDYRRAVFAGSPELGPGLLVYGLEYLRNDGPWENPNDFRKANGALRYAQGTAASGFSITGMAYKADWNSTDQIPRRAVDQGLIGRFGAIDPTDGGKSSRYSLSGEWRSAEKDSSRAISLYAIKSRLTLFSNFTFFLDDPANGDQFEQAEERLTLGGQASQTWYGRLAERSMLNTVGLQLRRDRIDPVALYSTAARERLSTTREDRVTVASGGPYFSNAVEWSDWFRTIAGVRADFYRFDVESNIAVNSGKNSDAIVSPKLSAIFGPWDKTEYFLNWGQGFHSNDARGTTITVDPKTGVPADRVSPLVRTTGYETGVRSQIVPQVTTSLVLWELKQDSELLFVGDAGTTEASRPSKRTGLEWLVQWLPARWIALDLTAALTRARFSDDDPAGDRIPGAPDSVASAGATLENLNGWFGSVRWRYFGPRPLIEDNSVRSQSTSLVNARVGYTITKRIRAYVDVFNLFDRKASDIDYYYTSRLQGEPALGVDDVHFHPVESRALRATLAATF